MSLNDWKSIPLIRKFLRKRAVRSGESSAQATGGGRIACVFLTDSLWAATQAFHILSPANIRVCRAATLEEASMLLRVLQARVLLTDPIFAEGRWTDALQLLKLSHPGVSIVVAVNTPDAKLEEALLEAGGFGVTAFPFSRLGLVGVVRGAHACAPGASSSVSGQLGKEQAKGETKQSHTETVAASVHRLRRGIFSSCAISQWLRRCLPIRQ